MRNYIILNNKNSNTISGLIIQELAPISKPAQRTQVETIDGRDGDIVTPLGYAAYNKKIKIGLYGNFDINDIIAYFATKGTVIFSNEPDKYYYYQIVDQIDYERLVRYRVATVTMHVQPFKYSSTEQPIIVDVSGQAISGEGSDIALDNTAEAPFNILRHKGNATQKTVAGINLLAPPDDFSRTINDVAVKCQNGIWTFNGTSSANGSTGILPVENYTIKEGDYWHYDNTVVSSQINVAMHFTDGTSGAYSMNTQNRIVSLSNVVGKTIDGVHANFTGGNTFNGIASPMILHNVSTHTDFEPYVGGIPSPNPDYPQDIQVVTGDSAITISDDDTKEQSYVIPFGDTYLAKIGDYADEPVNVDGTWYIRRAIGKVVLDGTQNFAGISTHSGAFLTVNYGNSSIANLPDASIIGVMSNKFRGATLANTWRGDVIYGVGQNTTGHYIQFSFPSGTFADTDGAKAWFGSNNTIVYYVLATPTDEAITDQDLIDTLDDFYNQAHGYKGHTHITASAEDGNAPAVLSVELNADNESTVTNSGNTTSRPILTVYGQGDIGLYINDVEVLDIALGDEGYITLDSVEMEAYKDTTANLKNRLVTGDYSKLALNAGANKIRFTGKVTKYEISKYSRWL